MSRVLKPCAGVVGEVIDDEVVLLNLADGKYFTLNATGTRMWQLIGELGDLDQVAAKLEREFTVDPARMRADLDELASSLVASGLALEET